MAFWKSDLFLCLLVLTLGGMIMLPLSAIVVHDYIQTGHFESRICSGRLEYTDIHTSLVNCARGKAITTFQNATGQFDRSVELYYPAVNWLLACVKETDVSSWLAGMSSSATFQCYIDQPDLITGLPDGIEARYSKIGGWIFMFVIAILFLVMDICLACYVWRNQYFIC